MNHFDKYDAPSTGNHFDKFDDAEPPKPGLFRSAGDSAIALGSGVTQGVKMLTDVAGADNAASRVLGKATDALTDLESPYRKAEKQARAAKIKQAEDSGSTWEQVKAYTGAFADAPLDTTLNAVGTSIPTLAAGMVTGGGAAASIAARAAQVGIGAAQGVGGIKGQIHESVKQKHLEAGATEADAAKRADAAQAYSGPNAGSIALGGALGAVAGGTGAESAVRRLAGQRVGAGAADAAAPGIVRSAARGVAHETPMEMLQGGQERYASNTALQGEGFDVPTMQGVVGQAALEGLASAPMGGGFGVIEGVARQGVAQRQGEGAAAFAAGEPRTPPDSIKSVAAKAQWVRGWDVARAEASTSPAPAPAGDVDVSGAPGGERPEASGASSTVDAAQASGAPADMTTPSNWETGTSPLAQQIQSSVQSAQDLAAQAMKPSQQMGLDSNAGPLSAAAVVAVDSGASDQVQAAAQQDAVLAQETREPAPKPASATADPETGEVASADRAQELQQRLQFVEQQARANGGWDMQLVTARDAARAELAALNPSSTSAQSSGARAAAGSSAGPAPARPAAAASSGAPDPAAASPGVSAGEQIDQLETTAANAQARAADWSSREYKPNSKPLPKYEAAGGPADVQEANEQRRLKEVVSAKTAASNALAQAETLRQQGNVQAQLAAKAPRVVPSADEVGAKAIAKEGAARRLKKKEQVDLQAELDAALSTGDEPGAHDNAFARASEDAGPILQNVQIQAAAPAVAAPPGASKKGPANVAQAPQAQQTKAQQPQAGGAPTARSAAAPGLNNATTTFNNGAQAAAPAGPQAQTSGETRDQRAQRVADAGAAWTRMPPSEREALAQRTDVKPILQKNLHNAQWENLNIDVKRKLADLIDPSVASLQDELGDGVGTYAEKLAAKISDARYKAMQGESIAPAARKINGVDMPALTAEVQRLEGRRDEAKALDAAAQRDDIARGMLKAARQELDASPIKPADRMAVVARAGATGNAADASQAIFDAVDGKSVPAAPMVAAAASEAATSDANDRPAPTEAQIEAGNYKKGHVRLNGHDIAIENPAGTKRRPEWPPLQNHYGYIKGSMGADKDHVDLFMTDRAEDASLPVFVVDQNNQDGTFDEHKVIMGAADEAEARSTYLGNYAKGWGGLGAITQMTQDEFKAWVSDPQKTKQRAAADADAANDRDRFTLNRLNSATDSMEPVTFVRGEVVKVAPMGKQKPWPTGTITGISHANGTFKVDGGRVEREFAFAYKTDFDEYARPRAEVDKQLDQVKGRLDAGNSIDADNLIRAAQVVIEREYLGDYAKGRVAELRKQATQVSNSVLDKMKAEKARKDAADAERRAAEKAAAKPSEPVRMTMEEWKAVHRDAKSIIDGQRMVLREGGMRKVEIDKPNSVPAKVKEAQAARANYFAPGNIVKSYGGHDRVIAYVPPTDGGAWSVTVQAVHKVGDAWVDMPNEPERSHATQPDAKAIKAGPVERAPAIDIDGAIEPMGLLDQHNAVERGISAGTLGLEQYQQAFAALTGDEATTMAELGKLTKDDLLRAGGVAFAYRYKGEKKEVIVKAAYNTMLDTYALGRKYGNSSFVMSAAGMRAHEQAQSAALRELVTNTTQDDLAARAAEIKAARDEFAAKRQAAASALENPKTLQDFRGFMRHWVEKGEPADAAFLRLTPEQRQQYDALDAENSREAREAAKANARKADVRSAGSTSAGEIIATKHTKHGHDLYVLQLADRVEREDYETLNTSARRLGGSYSSFRGNGAIPGFQFRTRDAAEAFQALVAGDTAAAQAVAQARRDGFEDDKSQTGVERLRSMADAIDAGAEAQLSAERKTNTARRARMAGAAEDAARSAKAYAGTMRNLADAIEAGNAPFLDGVRTKTQLTQLQQALGAAKAKQLHEKYGSWSAAEEHKHDPLDAQVVDFAEFPRFSMYRSDLAGLARQLLQVDGGKKAGAALAKVADDVSDAYTDWAKANLLQVSQFGRADQLAEFASRDDAERAIKRSGLVGNAVVLPIKRGQNRVVLSPGEAMQRGLWKGDGDKRINLSMDFVQDLVKLGKRRGSKAITIPWQLESTLEKRQRLQSMGLQTPAEYRSALRELVALRQEKAAPDRIRELERSMVGRANDGLDFFPTGSAATESALDAADIQPGMEVLEPSAGMGHVADAIREKAGVEPDVVEISGNRRELLEAKGYNLVGTDFLEVSGKQYDRIVMNPPFSDGRDIQHVRHAFSLLKPGGRVVAIMSESAFFQSNKRAEAFRGWLETMGATNEKLPDGSFMDPRLPVNTSVSARMVVIDKPGNAGAALDQDVRFSRVSEAEGFGSGGMTLEQAEQLLRIMGQAPEISPAAQAQAVGKVRKIVDAIRGSWANAPEVVVAYDMNDPAVPADARAEDLKQRSGGAVGAPEGFYWKGKTYLLASQLPTANDAARVLFHESLGHHGLRGAFGKDLDNILNQVATMRRADVDAKIAEYGLRATSAADRRNAAEEVLAEMAQATPNLHFVKRAIAAIRNWLRANVPGFRSLAMRDADIIQAFILPARRYVEQGAQTQGGVPALSFSRSAMKSVDANIARGRKAMAKALAERNTVNRAMFRNGLGWVDFVWGSEGVIKPSGRTKGAMGLVHLLEARHRKDGLAMPEVAQLLDKVVQTIASGQEFDRAQVGLSTRVGVEHESTIVWLTRREGSNAWIVTGYEKTPSDTTAGRATAASTHGPASLTRRNMEGAGPIVNEGGDENNPMFSRSKLADIKDKALQQIQQSLSHPGTVSLWDRSVGTMRNLAERVPAFKPVFEAAQQFIDDVSTLANEAADAAPRLLPRVDSWKDLKKQPISAADNKAVAAPVFEGTLMWGRDVDGTAVLVDSLAKKYAHISADEKGQLLLRAGRLDDGVLKMWRGLPVEMYEANINARFESQMLKAGVVWTDSELKDIFKANDHQISLYREARAGIDKSIDITSRADMLRALGEEYADLRDVVMAQATLEDAMKVITDVLQQENRANPHAGDRIAGLNNLVVSRYEQSKKLMDEGYAPLSRFGRYTVDVLDAAGDRQFFGMYETKREANQMALRMRDEFKGGAITQGTMSDEAFKLFQGITPESLEQFAKMLSLSGEPDSAQDKVFQEYLKLAKNNHSALKRLIHRKGIAGYSEDVGRVLASFVYSNARLAAGGLNAGTLESAVQAIPKEQGELRDVAMGLRSYIQDPQEEGQAVRGMLFAQYLGGSLASAMVNMTQPFAVTLPWLSQHGGIKKAGAQMARALKDMGTRGFQYEKDLALALRAAEDDGTVSPQEVHQLMAQARGAGGMRSGDGTRKGDALAQAGNLWEKTKVAWGQPFALAEQFNRRTTFIASYRIAKDQGMDNPGEFARKAVLETQFLYSKANKMRWARGAVGGTLMTFKTYSVSYLELMHRMWNQGGPEGKRAVAWSMAMLMLMGGAGGLPFMEDAEDLIDGAGQLMGYNFSLKQTRKDFLQEWIGKELSEFMESGLSGLPGAPIDVSGRLGMGNLIPGTGLALSKQSRERDLLEIAGPAGDLVSRGFAGARKLLTGDVAGAAVEVSPTAVRNALKGADMAASGIYKDTKGYKVIDTTLAEAASKFLGFQPRSVAEVQEANSFMQRSKSFYTQSSSEIKAQWADALFRKDDAALQRVRERLASWNRSNPDQPIVVKMPDIWKKVREMGKDRTERIAATAPKALRAQMREAAQEVSR